MSPAQGQRQRPKRPEDARPRAFPLRGEEGCSREEASAWSRSAHGDAGLRVQPRETHARGASRPPAWGQLSELSPSLSLRCVLMPPQAAPAAVTRRRGPGSLDDRRPCTHGPGGRGSEARASRGRPLPGPRSLAGAGRLLRAPSRGHPRHAHPPCRPLLWGGHRPCHVRARSPVVRTLSARSVNITMPTRL